MERSSGILLHISSLPSPWGIGTLGKPAWEFARFLSEAGQKYWQLLPLGPTGMGDSPYQSFSSFAGNPYFIDLELLRSDGLLTGTEIEEITWSGAPCRVDYGQLYQTRLPLLRRAFSRGWRHAEADVLHFAAAHPWLENYALFMALKAHFSQKSWLEWPDEHIRRREPEAVAFYSELLAEEIHFHMYLQYLFFRQWEALRGYAHSLGLSFIGDLPIYVSMDSADVWAEPWFFQLGEDLRPRNVAGVPPDDFTPEGQLWGNPLYDYARMQKDGFGWWIRRVEGAAALYDVIRFDHFRGFESYWSVPFGETTAKNGSWQKGPGMALVGVLTSWFPQLHFIAEDLGYLTPEVQKLLESSGLPGMKILEFAFTAPEPSAYLPHCYTSNCVCYPGTHDNKTAAQWLREAPPEEFQRAAVYLGLNEEEGFVQGVLRGGMSSVAGCFIAQMQDYLELGAESRMNIPGTSWGNWIWRLSPDALTPGLAAHIRALTARYGRCSPTSAE